MINNRFNESSKIVKENVGMVQSNDLERKREGKKEKTIITAISYFFQLESMYIVCFSFIELE
jgi:hypothetical protein